MKAQTILTVLLSLSLIFVVGSCKKMTKDTIAVAEKAINEQVLELGQKGHRVLVTSSKNLFIVYEKEDNSIWVHDIENNKDKAIVSPDSVLRTITYFLNSNTGEVKANLKLITDFRAKVDYINLLKSENSLIIAFKDENIYPTHRGSYFLCPIKTDDIEDILVELGPGYGPEPFFENYGYVEIFSKHDQESKVWTLLKDNEQTLLYYNGEVGDGYIGDDGLFHYPPLFSTTIKVNEEGRVLPDEKRELTFTPTGEKIASSIFENNNELILFTNHINKKMEEKRQEWEKEERREREEREEQEKREYLKRLEEEAIPIAKFKNDYKNEIAAEKKYNGKIIIIKCKLDKIERSDSLFDLSAYNYKVSHFWDGITGYTNDENFVKIDYPCTVIMEAKVLSKTKLVNCKLLAW
ncbi:hypothetical protein LJB91_01905 [Bacteroidales bacterium OttesenSCG-928-L03]|nr:hypothetical protein [Bacteroidales bacterium OttesenSCG-928-L03]